MCCLELLPPENIPELSWKNKELVEEKKNCVRRIQEVAKLNDEIAKLMKPSRSWVLSLEVRCG